MRNFSALTNGFGNMTPLPSGEVNIPSLPNCVDKIIEIMGVCETLLSRVFWGVILVYFGNFLPIEYI